MAHSSLRFLVIDDNPDDRRLAIRTLTREFPQLKTDEIFSGEALAEAFKGPSPDLVVTDFRLLWTDGLQVLAKAKKLWPDCPVVMFTGTGNEEVAVQAMKRGLDDYVLKSPRGYTQLVRAVSTVLELASEKQQRVAAQTELARRSRLNAALADVTRQMLECSNLADLSKLMHGYCMQATRSTHCVVAYLSADGAELHAYPPAEDALNPQVRVALVAVANAVRASGEAMVSNQLAGERELPPEATALPQVERVMAVPAAIGDSLIGILVVAGAPTDYQEHDRHALELLAERYALGVQRHHEAAALADSNQRLLVTLHELRETQEQIVQQERLRALGEMASGIAHDFNNSLTVIQGFMELLLLPRGLDDTDQARQRLQLIDQASRDAALVVSRLREFYRPAAPGDPRKPVDLHKLADEVAALTGPKWRDQARRDGKSIELECKVGKLPPVAASESNLREVLTNLVLNAVDAIVEEGQITIEGWRDGEMVALAVSDTGRGMPEETRRRCLEPFFTTKGVHGTGLGLAVVHGIIKRHNGRLEIESEEGKGTRITILLPRHQAPTELEETVETPDTGALSILVVDDEPLIRETIEELLKSQGHEVDSADGAKSALGLYAPGKYDLVITDWAMPEINGDQLAGQIRKQDPDQRILMITGFGSVMDVQRERPRHVNAVLGKPIDTSKLNAAIAKVMETAEESAGRSGSGQ